MERKNWFEKVENSITYASLYNESSSYVCSSNSSRPTQNTTRTMTVAKPSRATISQPQNNSITTTIAKPSTMTVAKPSATIQ